MSTLSKQITLFIVLGCLVTYILFAFTRQNERMSSCTRLYSKCTITKINHLLLGSIDIEYLYFIEGNPVKYKSRLKNVKAKQLLSQIKVGDTLPLLYCQEYPNLNTPIIQGEYLEPSGW